jgi:5-methylcytosine-specific restriction endonuclease McrA
MSLMLVNPHFAQRAIQRRYGAAHRETCRSACARWRARNPGYQVEWNRANSERHRAIVKKTNAKSETKQRRRRWLEDNPDKVVAQRERHLVLHPRSAADRMMRYREKHPETSRNDSARRRSRKKGLKLSEGLIELLLSEQGSQCPYCPADISKRYAIDHYMPLSRGGLHVDENIQLTCRPCNARKASKHPAEFLMEMTHG